MLLPISLFRSALFGLLHNFNHGRFSTYKQKSQPIYDLNFWCIWLLGWKMWIIRLAIDVKSIVSQHFWIYILFLKIQTHFKRFSWKSLYYKPKLFLQTSLSSLLTIVLVTYLIRGYLHFYSMKKMPFWDIHLIYLKYEKSIPICRFYHAKLAYVIQFHAPGSL